MHSWYIDVRERSRRRVGFRTRRPGIVHRVQQLFVTIALTVSITLTLSASSPAQNSLLCQLWPTPFARTLGLDSEYLGCKN